ncbi:MAG: chemotaxis protein CheW [Planctomycetota bacterium]
MSSQATMPDLETEKARDTSDQSKSSETYLVFELDGSEYAITVQYVREIITSMEPSPVPGAPNYIRGVINLRGRILPLVDMRKRFAMKPAKSGARECWIIMVLDSEDGVIEVGISVDSVCEVVHIATEAIDSAPIFNDDEDRLVFKGVAKTQSGVKLILDSSALVDQLRRDVQVRSNAQPATPAVATS